MSSSIATLGGGCFWCLEAVYQQLEGVTQVVSGYAGGHVANPTYEQVCGKKTGHAEVVQVTFDPGVVSYRDILEVFFSIHDPTTANRQGNDVGPQYRSVIFYHDDEQRRTAEEILVELTAEHAFEDPIVTEIKPLDRFYAAEEYHQNYYAQNAAQPYCAYVISPKIAKFRSKFAERLRA
ncbi:MAG TPA: peptide-methionine (S)-S-oxide reductase MsrA [Gemmatimonadaceae bacterium]|nr:peptide-methionine (S)-S-oxide reductase MsrA [Gemmatimonadaceae bacterium]